MYTLWLLPTSDAEPILRELIDDFASEHGTDRFRPHVTLLSRLRSQSEAERASEECVHASSGAIELEISGVSTSDEPLRCVVVELVESDELTRLRNAAGAAAGVDPNPDYRPHLSIVYGTLTREEREQSATAIARGLPKSIRFDRVDVVDTTGSITEWRAIGHVSLGR